MKTLSVKETKEIRGGSFIVVGLTTLFAAIIGTSVGLSKAS